MKRMLFVAVLMLTLSGCIHATTLVTLKPDGSGTVDEEIGMNPQTLGLLAAFAGGGTAPQMRPEDIFSEAKAREMADKMGVRFVSGAPIDSPALKGYHAKFAFDDVKTLKVRMDEARSRDELATKRDPFDFNFAKGASSSTLTIRIPQDLERPPLAQMGQRPDLTSEQGQQMMAMMRPMLAGMFVDVAVAVDGQIVKTNAPFVDGNRVTLVQLDMNKVMQDEAAWTKLQSAKTPEEMRNIAGVKMSTGPTISIEFRQ
jgi:hypothetical protein